MDEHQDDGHLSEADRPGENKNRGAFDGSAPEESLDLRVRRLEDVAFEGDVLRRSVDRLGLNATALGEALLQVDRNQQRLTQLGQELEVQKAESATKEEVAERERSALRKAQSYRKQVLGRVYVGGVVAFAVVSAAALASVSYVEQQARQDYQACQAGKKQIDAVRDYLNEVAAVSTNAALREKAIATVLAFPPVNCEVLK